MPRHMTDYAAAVCLSNFYLMYGRLHRLHRRLINTAACATYSNQPHGKIKSECQAACAKSLYQLHIPLGYSIA